MPPTSSRVGLSAAIGAYESLSRGDVRPLVDMLDDEVVWACHEGSGPTREVVGRAAVADLLAERVRPGSVIALHGLELLPKTLVVRFRRPWWEERPRWPSLFIRAFAGDFVQTVTVDGAITRITATSWLATAAEQLLDRSG